MLEIKDLATWLPHEVIMLYEQEGIKEFYPPQAESIERGILEGRSMVLAMPTASGKTLLAELAMLRAALKGKRSLYIVPLRALASEKFESFQKFRHIGIQVGISTGDFDKKDERLGRNQIIIATSEKADSLIRNKASWIKDLGVLIVDELHLIDSPDRGPTLEMTITKLLRLNRDLQVVGLSATIANGRELADWLNAEFVTSDWRPVTLREGIILSNRIIFPDSEVALKVKRDEALALVEDTLAQEAQILIFESSRRNAEAIASKLISIVAASDPELIRFSERILTAGESEMARKLAQCVSSGVAFHHAGLLPEQRRLVEKGFRRNKIKVIASTPTLAAGLNLPARRVLIRSYKRYETGQGMVPIKVIEYRQMAGRAGRPGLDPYGESFLVAKSNSEMHELMDHYILGSPEDIYSKLASESALRTHLLATIAAGFASSTEELNEFISTTFYAHQQDPWNMNAAIERVLDFLSMNGMIEADLLPTSLGHLVSRLYIDPLSAVIMIEGIKDKVRPSDLTLVHLITMTPNMDLLYIQAADHWLEGFIDTHYEELNYEENYDWLLREVKTTAALIDWISEVKEEIISDRYRISPGDIRKAVETAEWLMHSLAQISKHLDLGLTYRAEQLAQRVHYGAGPELLALLDLKGIGRVRARKLHQAGFTSLDRLRLADPAEIGRLIGYGIAQNVMQQLRREAISH
ncbi:MAG: ATP-dependent DNA helicase [Methanotrichaceae archaeon]|nr:ATP-dependent DNA helicase [Methanotrichaceae archaeon]